MPRGRTPAKADDSAIAAKARIEAFMRASALSATGMAKKIRASPSSVLRALSEDPPRWTKIFINLDNFVVVQNRSGASPATGVAEQLARLHVTGSAQGVSATAALLRAVADLLESGAAKNQ